MMLVSRILLKGPVRLLERTSVNSGSGFEGSWGKY